MTLTLRAELLSLHLPSVNEHAVISRAVLNRRGEKCCRGDEQLVDGYGGLKAVELMITGSQRL